MKKSFEYIIKISETEFYDKLKKHTAFNCSSSSYDNGYEFYCDNPNNITDLKVTSTSLLSREGILAPLIKIQTKQLDENLKVNLTLQSNKIYYFLAVLFSLAGVLFGLITYFSLANLCLAMIISIVFILIINLVFFIIAKSKITDAKERFATVYKGNIIKNLIMDCQSYTKYRPNETTGGIFVSWRRKEELPTGA